jgi:hypothetical protein
MLAGWITFGVGNNVQIHEMNGDSSGGVDRMSLYNAKKSNQHSSPMRKHANTNVVNDV